MIAPASRQEVQSALDRTRSAIMSSMLSRNDLQAIVNQVRMGLIQDIHSLHAENQISMKQAMNSRAQVAQRLGAVEASLARIEHKLQSLTVEHAKTSMTVGKMQTDNSGYLFQRI